MLIILAAPPSDERGRMSEFLNSAWNYINATPGSTDKLVGQTVDLGPEIKLRIKKIIAEGK